jgi:hypothetical protein
MLEILFTRVRNLKNIFSNLNEIPFHIIDMAEIDEKAFVA